MLAAGRTLDRYVLLGRLGAGGMAEVWLARHQRLGTLHALKVLYSRDPALTERLLREGRAQGGLGHVGVVAVTDVIDVDGAPGLVLEYVAGPSLDRVLERGPLDVVAVDALGRSVLAAVGAAHADGWVHRDLKPANVLLDLRGDRVRPRISDFGLAKGSGASHGDTATRAGVAMGTPAYMAPEQFRDSATVDARADVYALGALLYEAACGSRPFVGDSVAQLRDAAVEGRRRPLDELVADLPRRLSDTIERALSPDPAARFPDARAMLEAWVAGGPADEGVFFPSAPLRAWWRPPAEGESAVGSPIDSDTVAWSSPQVDPAEETLPQTPQPKVHRREARSFVGAAAVAAAGFAGVAGALWWAARPSGPAEVTVAEVWVVGDQVGAGAVASPGYASSPVVATVEGGLVTRLRGVTRRGAPRPLWGTHIDELVVERDDDGAVSGLLGLTESGALAHRVAVERGPGGEVRLRHLSPGGGERASPLPVAGLAEELGFPATGVEVERLTRPEAGKIRVRFEKSAGGPMATPNGLFGVELSVDADGRPIAWTGLGLEGAASVDAFGVARVVLERDDAAFPGLISGVRHEGPHGIAVAGEQGWASVALRRDAEGDVSEWRWFGPAGNPVAGPQGCQVVRVASGLDADEQACLDASGAATLSRWRWARRRRTLDDHGHVAMTSDFGVDGAPIASNGQVASWETRFSRQGELLAEGPYRGVDGGLVPAPDGTHFSEVFAYEDSALASRSWLDQDGRPVPGPLGAATIRTTHDAHENLIGEAAFDPDGAPTLLQVGTHRRRIVWDAQGRLQEEQYLDGLGGPAENVMGYATMRYERDALGHLTAGLYFDAAGQPVSGPDRPWAAQRERWSAAGHPVAISWFGPDGQPVMGPNGCVRESYEVNAAGWRTRTRCEDPNGALVDNAMGWAWVDGTFDAAGRETSNVYFNARGEPLAGCSREVHEFDARGRPTYERCFGVDGAPSSNADDEPSTQHFQYDEFDRKILQESLGPSGERVIDPARGHAAIHMRYHGTSDVHEEVWFEDPDGRPMISGRAGCARWVSAFDALDRFVGITYYGVDGAPMVHEALGYARLDLERDARGNLTRELRRGADGLLLPTPAGAVLENTFDAFGRWDGETWFDAEGRPAEGPDGHHRSWCVRGPSGVCVAKVRTRLDGTELPPE